jgi:site-specific recombinase XerC
VAWAYGIGACRREPASATVGAHVACLSSYFRFLIRMGVTGASPCDAIERPRTRPCRGPQPERREVRRVLAVVRDTFELRDRAILLVLVLTGRRRA